MLRRNDTELWSAPIWVDFNAASQRSPRRRQPAWLVPLDYPGTTSDLARYGITLVDGLPLVLFSYDATEAGDPDDLVALGVAERDRRSGRWVARFQVSRLCHQSDLDEADQRLFGRYVRERPDMPGTSR